MTSPPREIGRYEVLRPIARGGMAEVYLARMTGIEGFERLLALKRILPELGDEREFTAMFLDEMRLAATLQHANIVQVFDVGHAQGSYFFAMEYLHGQTLRAVLDRCRERGIVMPLEHALAIVVAVSHALHYAHEKRDEQGEPLRIVHRDVSPHNVFITYTGEVKLVDFGIAKATNRLTQTRTGTVKGKAPYMSPEQCVGRALDRRSDVFSLSAVLWESTVGERLFAGANEYDVMKQVTEMPVRLPTQVRRDYPRALEEIVLHGLKREREDRILTAEDLGLALEDFAHDQRYALSALGLSRFLESIFGTAPAIDVSRGESPLEPGTRSIPAGRKSHVRYVIGAAVGLAVAAGVWWSTTRRAPPVHDAPPVAVVVPLIAPHTAAAPELGVASDANREVPSERVPAATTSTRSEPARPATPHRVAKQRSSPHPPGDLDAFGLPR